MAGGAIVSDNRKQYPGNMTFRVFVTCFVAATGGLIFGYDLGISGGVTSMDSFLKEFFPKVYRRETSVRPSDNQYCKFNDETLTLFTSSLYLAALVSCSVSSFVTRRLGRKVTMFSGGALFFAGAICNAAAKNVWMLYGGRALLGFGIGCVNQSVPIYVSETAPAKYRGAMNIMFQFAITIGILIANLLNYMFAKIEGGWGWRLSLGGAAVPALIIMVGSFFLPDTPNSLLERGKEKEAREQLKKLRGIDNVDEEFNDLKAASDASKLVDNPWGNIFKRKYRPQLTFACAIPFFQQFTGMNVFVFYAPVLFKTMGFGNSASLMSAVITGIVNCAATIIAIVMADRAGRRTLFMEGGIQMLVCQLFITAAIAWKFGVSGHPGILPGWYSKSLVALMCIYIAGYAWSWGPLGWLVPSEIFPLEIRPAAQSINVGVNMVCTFIIAQIFTFILCEFKFGLFIFFMVFVIIMTIFIYKRLPETKGIPIEDMQQVWKDHPHWSKYVKDENEHGTIGGRGGGEV